MRLSRNGGADDLEHNPPRLEPSRANNDQARENEMFRFVVALLVATFGFATPLFATEKGSEPADRYVLAQAKAGEMIDINRAKAEELMTLQGIGEARAKAIIKGRPYKRKDELVQKKIIPESVYDGIKDQIVAKQ